MAAGETPATVTLPADPVLLPLPVWLARRAEIGRLVEVVLEDASALSGYRDGDEVTVRVVRPSGVTRAGITYADGSLFGAFRGLAAKMEAK